MEDERDVAGAPLQGDVGADVAQQSLPDVTVGVDEARHHDHPRGVDHLGIGSTEVTTHGNDLRGLDQDVSGGEVAGTVHGEHRATADQLAIGGDDREVAARRIERGDLDGGGGPAAEHQAAGAAVVPLDQFLEIAHLEHDHSGEDQQSDDQRSVVG